ncbi:MAG: SirB1 family protein [Acidimicrobiia bacterium]
MDLTARFAELMALPEDAIPLDEAAMILAAHALPDLEVRRQLDRLDRLAADCPEATLEGLRRYLFADLGFVGDARRYHDPRNSYLPEVLDRRLGIPISLAVLAIEVGRRLGVALVGIGMPGHFLVRADGPAGSGIDPGPAGTAGFMDCFAGGRMLDTDGCAALYGQTGQGPAFSAALLAPVGARVILGRMLANLQGIFLVTDLGAASWVVELRQLIPGLGSAHRLDVAQALGRLGRFTVAAAELELLADEYPATAATLTRQARALRARAN